jgi:hypothetical protein
MTSAPNILDDRPGQQRDPGDGQHRAERVEPARLRVARLGQQQPAGHERDDHHGHVHGEHRAPREVPQQYPARHRADRHGEPGHGRPDADRRRPLARVGEHVVEDRQRGGVDQRGGHAHRGAGGDELAAGLRERGADGRQAEQRQPQLQEPPPAEAVAEVAAEQQQPGEAERVRVDDPLQGLGRRVQVAADRRQRDVDDHVVHDHEQDAEAEHRQDPPPAVVARFHLVPSSKNVVL